MEQSIFTRRIGCPFWVVFYTIIFGCVMFGGASIGNAWIEQEVNPSHWQQVIGMYELADTQNTENVGGLALAAVSGVLMLIVVFSGKRMLANSWFIQRSLVFLIVIIVAFFLLFGDGDVWIFWQ